MGQIFSLPARLVEHSWTYYRGMYHYMWGAGRTQPFGSTMFLKPHPSDPPEQVLFKQNARVHLFSLASNFYLYNKPHYRKGSYRTDLIDNLRNVAIPGTGLPLSWFVRSQTTALSFLMGIVYPAVSLTASFHQWIKTGGQTSIAGEYATRLLAPNDWFNYWRMNCNVVGMHALLNDTPEDYEMENKWTFLKEGKARGVPVSPYLASPDAIVVKHRNEEGGLGIHFFKNAVHGGDWIIQERIQNSDWVSSLLPATAPLSTFRVITCSRRGFRTETSADDITSLSCVFRAGRAGAATDHDSILFDVDTTTGLIQGGTTNAHWYRLGGAAWLSCPWRSHHNYRTHPDGKDLAVSGNYVPDMAGILKLVEEAHAKLCPLVPLAGWDVVLSTRKDVPICLLEVNLSCKYVPSLRGVIVLVSPVRFLYPVCPYTDSLETSPVVPHVISHPHWRSSAAQLFPRILR